jgi:hypothetical protein
VTSRTSAQLSHDARRHLRRGIHRQDTLAIALAEHYQTTWVPEFGRLYTEARVHRGELWRSDEFTFIATEQGAHGGRAGAQCQSRVDLRYRCIRHCDLA